MFNYSSPRRPHYAVSLYVQPVLCPHLFVSSLPSTIIQRSPSFKQKTQRSLLSCTFSNPSASPLCSCLPLVPTAASVSWQNIEGKFHGWWRRCENVTLWAINKEVWLTLTGPFFTWVCFAAFLASFFSPPMYTFLSSAVVHEPLICIGKNFLMHFNFYTHPHAHIGLSSHTHST